MGNAPTFPSGTVRVRRPVSQIPLRLRRAHPHAFDPHTLCLGPNHVDEDWNVSRDSKSRAVFASLSKPDSGFQPEELWLSIADKLAEAQPISTIFRRKFHDIDLKAMDGQTDIQLMVRIPVKIMELVGDSVFLVSSFLADLHASPETMPDKYGAVAIHDAAKLDNQLPLDLLQAVVAGLPAALEKAAFQKKKDAEARKLAAMLRAPFAASEFPKVVRSFCRFYSPFPHAEAPNFDLHTKKSLLDCLHASVSGEFELKETATGTARRPETVEQDSPTAKEMVRAGIRFEPGQAKNIADIRFEDGVLRLPALVLSDVTETVLRNLMVLEVSYKENPVSEYVWFLKGMVGGGDDVAVLREAGVLQGHYGKNERVAKLIKSLDDSYFFCPYYFPPIRRAWEDLKDYCDQKRKEELAVQATRSAVTGTADERKEADRVDGLVVSGKKDEGKEAGRVDGLAVNGKADEEKGAGRVDGLAVSGKADEGKEAGRVDTLAVSGNGADEGKEAGRVDVLTVPEMADARKGIIMDGLVVPAAAAAERKRGWKDPLAVVAVVSVVSGFLLTFYALHLGMQQRFDCRG